MFISNHDGQIMMHLCNEMFKILGPSLMPFCNEMFVSDPGGQVMTQFYNEMGNPSYKYFYSDAESVTTAMKKVKDTFINLAGRASEEL